MFSSQYANIGMMKCSAAPRMRNKAKKANFRSRPQCAAPPPPPGSGNIYSESMSMPPNAMNFTCAAPPPPSLQMQMAAPMMAAPMMASPKMALSQAPPKIDLSSAIPPQKAEMANNSSSGGFLSRLFGG